MAQHDMNIANATFPAVRTDINNALSAIQTSHSGTSLPSGAVAGQIWLDTTNATSPTLKFYDGADSISLATINYTANTVDWLDSTISITGLSTTATGTVITISDTENKTSVNLIIDNQKEIRFRETTANGTNYIGLKAPASVTTDLTFTLPVAPTASNQALISSTAGVMSFTPYTFPSSDGTNGQALVTNGSGVLSFASAGTSWQSVQTTGFTAVAGRAYPCNTTSAAFTVTLPASPSVGDTIILVDYAGTFATNKITLGANSNKIEGGTGNKLLTTNREAITLTYVDATQGWVSSSGANEGTVSIDPLPPYSIDFLVVAGGGGGGNSNGGGGGAGGYRTSTQTVNSGTAITVTVGDGGVAGTSSGSNSSISGSGLTTITSAGGGLGGNGNNNNAVSGGSGGGAGNGTNSGGSGNTPSTSPSQGNGGGSTSSANSPNYACGGGGGASASGGSVSGGAGAGGAGGVGTASSITGSSVTRAGGGGGAADSGRPAGSGGSGGGGNGGAGNGTGVAGTANTGGGGGGNSANGGKGIVILSVPTANYSGTSTGSPTITTTGIYTILSFTGTGSYTA